MKIKAGLYNTEQVAKVLHLNRASVGDMFRRGVIPEPIEPEKKKHWYWLKAPIDALARAWNLSPKPHEDTLDIWPIEKSIECPWNPQQLKPLVLGGRLCPIEAMNPEESFYISGKGYDDVSEACYRQARNNLMMIYMREDYDGIRIWRVM